MDKNAFLKTLVGQPLAIVIKSAKRGFYIFLFTKDKDSEIRMTLLVECLVRVVWKDAETADILGEALSKEDFEAVTAPLVGQIVRRVRLNRKNDLQVDFGECKLVFETHIDSECSWSFSSSLDTRQYLVAASDRLDYRRY